MITSYDTKITMSKGDEFSKFYQLVGFDINPTDVLVFTVKEDLCDKNALIRKEYTGITDDLLKVYIPSDETDVLERGRYVYDIVLLVNGDATKKTTLIYPSELIVKGVVHNE